MYELYKDANDSCRYFLLLLCRYLIAAGFVAGVIVGGVAGSYLTKQSFSRIPRTKPEDNIDDCLSKIKEIENSLLTDTQEYKDAYNSLYQSHQKLSDG